MRDVGALREIGMAGTFREKAGWLLHNLNPKWGVLPQTKGQQPPALHNNGLAGLCFSFLPIPRIPKGSSRVTTAGSRETWKHLSTWKWSTCLSLSVGAWDCKSFPWPKPKVREYCINHHCQIGWIILWSVMLIVQNNLNFYHIQIDLAICKIQISFQKEHLFWVGEKMFA